MNLSTDIHFIVACYYPRFVYKAYRGTLGYSSSLTPAVKHPFDRTRYKENWCTLPPTEINSVIDIYTRYVQACARKKKYRSVYRRSRGPFHGVRSREPRARIYFFSWRASLIRRYSSTYHRNEYRDIFSLYRSQFDEIHNLSSYSKESLNLYHDTFDHPSMCTEAHFGGREFFLMSSSEQNGRILKTLFRRVSDTVT